MAPVKKTTHPKTTRPKGQSKKAPQNPLPDPGILTAGTGIPAGTPVFADPTVTPDPTKYKVPHASDGQAYKEMDQLIKASKFPPLAFTGVPGVVEPVLTLASALGAGGEAAVGKIQQAGQIVFHSVGDTGETSGPKTEELAADKMLTDFDNEAPNAVPQFFYHLGDIVYSFGEHKYYYDQFYNMYRDYPKPIFAIAGNHDGVVLPPPAGTGVGSLSAFLANFCSSQFTHATDAMGISRTTMIQPGVYFTLDAPYVRILGLYSNVLENPGVISTQQGKFPQVTDVQLDYLEAALTRVGKQNYKGAVIIAVHHPPYSFGKHSGSLAMLKEIDGICKKTGVWPHAVLSGHAHNYQRYTRAIGGREIPYLVAGNGGHHLNLLSRTQTLRTPTPMHVFEQPEAKDTVTFESYDDKNFGYLRILVSTTQLRIEYHPAPDGGDTKTPDDSVTVGLAGGKLIHYNAPA